MRILAILAASYTVAVLCAVYGGLERSLLPLCAIFGLAALVCLLSRKRTGRRGVVLALWTAGLALGFGWTAGYQNLFVLPAREMDDQTVRLTAQVLQYPQQTQWGYSVLAETKTAGGTRVDTLLYVDEQSAQLRPGDEIETIAHLTFADKTYAGEEITYYTAKGVFLRGECHGQLHIQRPQSLPLRFVPAVLSRALEENILAAFSEETGPQVLAIVTGNRDRLTQPFTSSLQRTGLSHVAAVSGMHLAFLAGAMAFVLGRHRRRTALIVVPAVLLFMLVAGCTPSIVRAAVMILMLQIAPLLGRERDDFTSLGTALLILLIQNPLAVTHVGLQLSFAAVAGIFLVAEPVGNWLSEKLPIQKGKKGILWRLLRGLRSYFVSTLSATFGSMVFTVPLTAIHFSSLSLLSPVSNLLTLWAVAAIFCGGIVTGLLGFASLKLATLAAMMTGPFAVYLDRTMEWLSRLTFASVTMDSFYYKAWVTLFCLGVFAALGFWRGKKRIVMPACLAVITLCCAMMLTAFDFNNGPMSVTALDVGQGQCILLRQGDFLTVVDCGGDSYDNAGDVAANHLQNSGHSRVDLLVLTHFHDDHANGVPQLLRRLEVSVLAVPETEEDSPLQDEILTLAAQLGIECWTIRDDTRVELDEARAIQLYAPLGGREINERGLSVLASVGNWDTLITGDMGGEVEQLLLAHADIPKTELLVAGHHGSADSTSQQLLDKIKPEIALISVGEHNDYGHPAGETLERLASARVLRTDHSGTISVRVSKLGLSLAQS